AALQARNRWLADSGERSEMRLAEAASESICADLPADPPQIRAHHRVIDLCAVRHRAIPANGPSRAVNRGSPRPTGIDAWRGVGQAGMRAASPPLFIEG